MLSESLLAKSYELLRECQLLFVIGTSGYVYPAASFPLLAKENDAYLVEINIERTNISNIMDEVLLGPAGEILPEIIRKIKN